MLLILKIIKIFKKYYNSIKMHGETVKLTSVSLNFLTGISSWPGVSRACKISSSSSSSYISELYGLKTLGKCSVCTFAFCVTLCAHSASSVLSGEMSVCGRFKLLVAFHNEYSVASVAVKLFK
jgi:hypothetical protein